MRWCGCLALKRFTTAQPDKIETTRSYKPMWTSWLTFIRHNLARNFAMDLNNPFSDSKTPSVVPSSTSSAHQVSIQDSAIASQNSTYSRPPLKRRFKSYLLTGEYERPWLNDKRLQRTRVNNYIIYGFLVAGIAVSGYINYNATTQVPKHSVS